MGQVIVFCKTKLSADQLSRDLKRDGHAAEAIHGDKSQASRLETLAAFKEGSIKVLVATDVAARGLDISELPYVVNYELPNAPEDYVHRIGRTGRAGASGVAISLMCQEESRQLEAINKLIRKNLEAQPVEGFWPGWMPRPAVSRPAATSKADALTGASEGVKKPRQLRGRGRTQREIPALLLPPRYKVVAPPR